MEFALLALICPIGMGLMMLFMAKGMSTGRNREDKTDARSKSTDQLTLEELQARQDRIASQISLIERDRAASSRR